MPAKFLRGALSEKCFNGGRVGGHEKRNVLVTCALTFPDGATARHSQEFSHREPAMTDSLDLASIELATHVHAWGLVRRDA